MKRTLEKTIFDIVALIITTLFAIICILPILLTISGSLTPERELLRGMKLIPDTWTLDAYRIVFRNGESLARAYWVTIKLVVIGTACALFLTSMTSYTLFRKDFRIRNKLSFYFFFTTLFNGGLVSNYILMCTLGLRNTFTVLMIGTLMPVMYVIIMRSYFTSNIPQSLVESAKIDGANDFLIYLRIVLPSAGPILATVGLLMALGYWNNWSTAAIYISDRELYPLQYYLYQIFQEQQMQEMMANAGVSMSGVSTPKESYKLAMTVFTMGPVVLFYPFVQRFFVSGVTIGAVKE